MNAKLAPADPILDEMVRRLVDAFHPERVYLFGSRARGEAGPDSDYDLMLVLASADEPGYRLSQKAHALLWDLGVAADVLVWTRQAFDARLHLKASLPSEVASRGVLLHAA